MKNDKISIIMSTKDTEEKILRESIESILNQSYQNFEFIIVCDGSKKDLQILNEYKLKDQRIIIIIHEQTKGLPFSLNEAIEKSTGKYIARMDSDDISLPKRLEIQFKFMERHQEINLCSTFAKNIGTKENYIVNIFNKGKQTKAHLLVYNCAVHPTVMMRRDFLIKNNIRYDIEYKYSQDYELWARCCKITDFYIIPRVCLHYRVHKNQISTAKIDEQNALCENIYIRNLKDLNFPNPKENVKYLFYLGGKVKEAYDIEDVKKFIDKVIDCNRIKKIYDEKELKKILMLTFAKITKRNNNKIIPLSYILEGHVISSIIKRIVLLTLCKIKMI